MKNASSEGIIKFSNFSVLKEFFGYFDKYGFFLLELTLSLALSKLSVFSFFFILLVPK